MNPSRLLIACTTLAACTAFAACGTDSERDDNGGGSAVPIEQAVDSIVELVCERAIDCCDATEFPYQTQDDCIAQFGALVRPEFDGQVEAVQDGRQNYDGTLARTCMNQMQSATCEDGILPVTVDECETVFSPNVAVGGRCLSAEDCISGICSGNDGDTEGTCVEAAVNETCPNDCQLDDGAMVCFQGCGDTLVCSFPDEICVEEAPAPGVGEDCSQEFCQDEFFCNDAFVCEARRAAGAQCDSDDQCENFDCDDGGVCSTSTCNF